MNHEAMEGRISWTASNARKNQQIVMMQVQRGPSCSIISGEFRKVVLMENSNKALIGWTSPTGTLCSMRTEVQITCDIVIETCFRLQTGELRCPSIC